VTDPAAGLALVPRTITTRELAELAGVTVRSVQRAAARGRFTFARPGRDYVIEEHSGLAWARSVRRPGPKPARPRPDA
jgi:excisionase family DNA binding protein